MKTLALTSLATLIAVAPLRAQTPMPIVVAAATPAAPAPVVAPKPVALPAETISLKDLEAMKAANEETLRKQAATLQQLDELAKAAEQIRIFSRRG